MIHVTIYNLDGMAQGEAELARDALGQLTLDQAPVLAVSLWGNKIALTMQRRLVLIDLSAYRQLTPYAGLRDAL